MQYSLILPVDDSPPVLDQLVPELVQAMARLGRPFEMVCVASASAAAVHHSLSQLARQFACLKIVPIRPRSGLSTALTAGIAAARGEVVVAIEASRQYLPEQISWLTERLARADLVVGRRERGRASKCCLALAQLPRRVLLGLEVRDPNCLFWAARREALDGLQLSRGMHRFLGSLVSTRGYRVSEIHVDHRPEHAANLGSDGWPNFLNLLAVCWDRWRERSGLQPVLPQATGDASCESLQHRKAA